MTTKTEKQKMLDGELYMASDLQLSEDREYARKMTRTFNQTTETDGELRTRLLKELFGSTGEHLGMEPNIHVDYGYNIHVGNHFYTNFNCTILDVVPDNMIVGGNPARIIREIEL